jgi:hypothetical protein
MENIDDVQLLKFWRECLKRRAEHYKMHRASADVLDIMTADVPGTMNAGASLMGMLLTQVKFTTDAHMKLCHARRMVEFFEARLVEGK